MTLKYESELIKEIVDTRGHETPLLHYESECVESWISETEGAYPKLTDYESEWLNYIVENPIGKFPYVTLSDVTEATVENVVPYAYKSAILKGQTLINLSPFTGNNGVYELNTSTNTSSHVLPMKLQQNKRYIFIFKLTNSQSSENSNYIMCRGLLTDGAFKEFGRKTQILPNGRHWFMLSSNEGDIDSIFVGTNFDVTLSDTMIIEYQDGMENWDIPYFEGMTSVKMPVLTTTGKNLFNESEKIEGYFTSNYSNEQLVTDIKNTWTTPWIKAKTNTNYTIQGGNRNRWQTKSNNNVITFMENKTITTLSDTEYIRCYYCSESYIASNVQLEESSSATSYEPYKTNILTVNEPIELRGIGDVQDELNLLTGEVTERIGEIVLDDTLSYERAWGGGRDTETDYVIGVKVDNHLWNVNNAERGSLIKCDKLRTRGITSSNSYGYFLFYVSKSVLGVELTNAKIREYILSLNATVQYPLATPVIKTVDLTVTDQDGNTLTIIRPIEGTMHVSTSSQTLPPLLDMSVPVEATTQNLMSFINIEEGE